MNILDRVLSLVAPDICVGCGFEGSPLCAECIEAMPILNAPICYECGRLSRNYKTCDKCLVKYKPQQVYIACEYNDSAKNLVKAYKFSYVRRASVIIAEQLDEVLPFFAEKPVLTFVPTVSSHIRERGFDHAVLITKELAKIRGWNYISLLTRQTNKQQHGATKKERIDQIKNAFRIRDQGLVKNKHILLVDDITTTGATLNECTKMLLEAGAARVDAVVFARTMEK